MDGIPDALWRNILSYVGTAADFRTCEKTCKLLNRVLKDDDVWKLCEEGKPPEEYDRPYLHRELALIPGALEHVRKWQRGSDSIILGVLKIGGWKRLVDEILSHSNDLLPADVLEDGSKFEVRGDTSAALLEIVEAHMISQLYRSQRVACHTHRSIPNRLEFAFVLPGDLRLQNCLALQPGPGHLSTGWPSNERLDAWNAPIEEGGGSFLGIGRTVRDNVVRRLAYRAGIVKMEYQMYRLVWTMFLHTILEVLKPTCILLKSEVDPRALHRSYINPTIVPTVPKRVVTTNAPVQEVIRNMPPLPRLSSSLCCPNCRKIPLVYTIVPKQVEKGAELLGIAACKVYGDEWHLDEATDEDGMTTPATKLEKLVAIAEAKSQYSFQDIDSGGSLDFAYLPTWKPTSPWDFNPAAEVVMHSEEEDSEDDKDSDDEAYKYEEEEEEDEYHYGDLVSVDNELPIMLDHDDSDCTHPLGFVPFATLPAIVTVTDIL